MSNETGTREKNGKADINILKSRDDPKPVCFEQTEDGKFKLCRCLWTDQTELACSWVKKEDAFGPEQLRKRIEPWLTALVQSEYLSLLIS